MPLERSTFNRGGGLEAGGVAGGGAEGVWKREPDAGAKAAGVLLS